MTKEELEKDYYADRPTEPYSDDDNPNDWANIAHYAEENLERAFKRIAELEAQIEKMKSDVNTNIKFAQQSKDWLMESKLASMILQWEGKRNEERRT